MRGRRLVVLGIETSCDDTAIGIVRSDRKILANVRSSQFHIHREYGGVMPLLAARAHKDNLGKVLDEAMNVAGLKSWSEIDAIAVTSGPGLKPCLEEGLVFAKGLGKAHDVPVIPVNHLEAHTLSPRVLPSTFVGFPYLTMLATGGHTMLIRAEEFGKYTVLGRTLDDAIGEAFDKVARVLGIYDEDCDSHAGRLLEELAKEGDPNGVNFSVPLQSRTFPSFDFSFSGLKAQVARYCESEPDFSRANVAASFQRVAAEHLVNASRQAILCCGHTYTMKFDEEGRDKSNFFNRKSMSKKPKPFPRKKNLDPETKKLRNRVLKYTRAQKQYGNDHGFFGKVNGLVVVGGVANNQAVQKSLSNLCSEFDLPFLAPSSELCADNGVMIAWSALEMIDHDRKTSFAEYEAPLLHMEPFPRAAIQNNFYEHKER